MKAFFSCCCANSLSLALLWSGLLSSTFTHPCEAQIYVNNSLTALIMCLSAVAQTHFLQVSTSLVQGFFMCERSSKQKLCLLSQTTDFHKHSHTHTQTQPQTQRESVYTHCYRCISPDPQLLRSCAALIMSLCPAVGRYTPPLATSVPSPPNFKQDCVHLQRAQAAVPKHSTSSVNSR